MNTYLSKPVSRIILVALASIVLTISVFLAGMSAFLGTSGLYDSSYSDYERHLVAPVTNELAYKIIDQYVHEDEKGATFSSYFNPVNYPDYDFKVTLNGQEQVNTFDKKADYLYSGQGLATFNDNRTVVNVYLKSDYQPNGHADFMMKLAAVSYKFRYPMILAAGLLGILSIIAFVLMLKYAGRREDDSEIHLRKIDRCPAEIPLIVWISVISPLLDFGLNLTSINMENGLLASFIIGICCCALTFWFAMYLAVQIKAKALISSLITYRVLKFAGCCFSKLPLIWKLALPAGIILFINFMITGVTSAGDSLPWAFIFDVAVFAFICYAGLMMRRLEKGASEILSGNTAFKINTDKMITPFKDHAHALNSINQAVDAAASDRLKSERLKTELITNVSHDIKTPLTSIINYTDLLTSELSADKPDMDAAREYVDTISGNALRLKKLTSDIVEVSKASTGNIDVNLQPCSLGTLLSQALGEYEEAMTDLGLTPVCKLPEEEIWVKADGQITWRIFDNLMSNICKYAQPMTRVYMDITADEDKAYVSFKNTSADELNISADELLERFVRGDVSRNTDGSGLGLSIADNMAALQGGRLNLSIDGDLFKAIVEFQRV